MGKPKQSKKAENVGEDGNPRLPSPKVVKHKEASKQKPVEAVDVEEVEELPQLRITCKIRFCKYDEAQNLVGLVVEQLNAHLKTLKEFEVLTSVTVEPNDEA